MCRIIFRRQRKLEISFDCGRVIKSFGHDQIERAIVVGNNCGKPLGG